ncbi:asparagine synthase-related protein [Marinimicrobium sp. ABcell2]|uniref:asparagine synthase-related protein n=1 Tax=Marinimicrobium sp. ABcell2 TaxID=3069751 RepID=UPI0027B10C67|nr:asparagine synthase-related protein [Marinimicrobium sp. ABcell2]MDQ2077574.1 asparagine synthase-related protein [Marinimicrobium sp. ABcell2]
MSGFGGVVYPAGETVPESCVGGMSASLAHRGDADVQLHPCSHAGFFVRQNSSGVYKASIHSSDTMTVVADGHVHGTDGRNLLGSQSLAEFVHAAYLEDGLAFLDDMDGGFAICLYDHRSERVTLIRDMFARRPLYYGIQDGRFWFASEISPITQAPDFTQEVNVSNLPQQLTYRGNFGPETLFKDIYKAIPGFCAKGKVGSKPTLHFYANVPKKPKLRLSARIYGEKIWTRLVTNVRASLSGGENLKTGLLLSGGTDSALLAKAQMECDLTNPLAVSCGYSEPDALDNDETHIAEQNALLCELPFKSTLTSSNDDLLSLLRRIVLATEEPPRTFIAIPIEKTLSAVQNDVDCLMTGTFADALFGEEKQYDTPIYGFRNWLPERSRNLIRKLLPALRKIPRVRGYAAWFKRGDVDSMQEYLLKHERFNGTLRGLVEDPELAKCAPHISQVREAIADFNPEDEYTLTDHIMYGHCWNELFEQLSSQHGIDVVHPFQGRALYDLSLEMPYRGKICRKHTKPYLRALTARLFSPEFAYREKTKFSSPGVVWLSESQQLQDFVYTLSSPKAKIREYLNGDAINAIIARYREQVSIGRLKNATCQLVYTLIGLELWLDCYFPDRRAQTATQTEAVAIG